MMYAGSMIIGILLAVVGVCPIDFATNTFQWGDLAILVGVELLWCIIYSVAKKR